MKLNWKSFFKSKPSSLEKASDVKLEETDYDTHVDFYYTNLINSLILFTYDSVKLNEMASILIDPLTELFEELQYAFTPVCFDTVVRMGLVTDVLKEELLTFKKEIDDIPVELWEWELLDQHETWLTTRQKATALLDKLGVTSRSYNDDYVTIYDKDGNILKKGTKCN